MGIATYSWQSTATGATVTRSSVYRLTPTLRTNSPPTVTTYNPVNANSQCYNLTDSADTASTSGSGGDNWVQITTTGNAGLAVNEQIACNWTIDAEL